MKLKHLTMRLYVIYVLNTHKISFKLDDIYYLINKLVFYAQFYTKKKKNFKFKHLIDDISIILLIFDFLKILQVWKI